MSLKKNDLWDKIVNIFFKKNSGANTNSEDENLSLALWVGTHKVFYSSQTKSPFNEKEVMSIWWMALQYISFKASYGFSPERTDICQGDWTLQDGKKQRLFKRY